MKKKPLMLVGLLAALGSYAIQAGEHPMEHPVPSKEEEHPSGKSKQSKMRMMKAFADAVKDHVAAEADEADGAFVVRDEKLDKEWRLKLLRIHEKKIARISDDVFFACADFKELKGRNKVDLDFYADKTDSGFEVREVLIHKVNGKPRFTYDKDNRRIPVTGDRGSSGRRSRSSKTVYACPMDGYISNKPGKCPKCGMELQRVKQ